MSPWRVGPGFGGSALRLYILLHKTFVTRVCEMTHRCRHHSHTLLLKLIFPVAAQLLQVLGRETIELEWGLNEQQDAAKAFFQVFSGFVSAEVVSELEDGWVLKASESERVNYMLTLVGLPEIPAPAQDEEAIDKPSM
jgi:hypothetical protein